MYLKRLSENNSAYITLLSTTNKKSNASSALPIRSHLKVDESEM